MKQLFYITSTLSIVSIAIGVIRFDNFRDRLYLFAMLVMFMACFSGLSYLIQKHK